MKKDKLIYIVYIAILISIFLVVHTIINSNSPVESENYTYTNLIEDLEAGNISKIEVSRSLDTNDYGRVNAHLPEGRVETVIITSMADFNIRLEYAMNTTDIIVDNLPSISSANAGGGLGVTIFIIILSLVFISVIVSVVSARRNMGSAGSDPGAGGANFGRDRDFGKSRAKMSIVDVSKYNFDSVAGLKEEKEELREVIDFLKNPDKYRAIGARIPKGILLSGPPGTGKTLLARAIASEAAATFFSASGSDFIEMYVGVGASRVRNLFEMAKNNKPAIIFIDEIDAVGRKRGTSSGGGNDEREQTLNQLLIEMDGFSQNEGIIVIAATNRVDTLDNALLRPGRFDRQVAVSRPDVIGRLEIIKVHAVGKTFAPDVDFDTLAQSTSGFTGADLENLLNEAAILSVRSGKTAIDMTEIRKAFVKNSVGTEKKSRRVSAKEKMITAYHEIGHAIIHEVLPSLDSVHLISIIPTGPAGGYTMPLPAEDRMYLSRGHMQEEIVALLGGRAAEEIIIKDVTTGASNDIQRVTTIARDMVTKYGMSESVGAINFMSDDGYAGLKHSDHTVKLIDEEVKNIVDSAYKKALDILNKNIELMHKASKLLIEKEKLTGEEFRSLFDSGIINKEMMLEF